MLTRRYAHGQGRRPRARSRNPASLARSPSCALSRGPDYGKGMDEGLLRAYLRRIGTKHPGSSSAAALRALHKDHQLTVPFENLSIHLDEPISLNDADLIDKIVARRRGGFCYELNGAFALLLEALGFEVRRVAARVYGSDGLGPPFDHLALVGRDAGGARWLAD